MIVFTKKNCYSEIIIVIIILRSHPVGTASMGRPNDKNAVVDSKMRVRGVLCLRIVDGSIYPRTTNANINGPIMMAAEKAAAEIIEEHDPRPAAGPAWIYPHPLNIG